jgi:hypothetical protein
MIAAYALLLADEDPPAEPQTSAKPIKTVAKGHCRYCEKHIGRGLWRHEQKCEARP